MKKSTKWFIIIFFGILFFVIIIKIIFSSFSQSIVGGKAIEIRGSGEKIAVVEVFGEILSSEKVVEQLKEYADDISIKAIVLHINSPGGSVAPSQEIYEEIKKMKIKKPIITSMSSLAASGGYYIACASTYIVANQGTITGSIGVISQFFSFEKLIEKIGVSSTTIKSGEMKDVGNPFREMGDEEKKFLEELINNIHNQFVNAVANSRKIPYEEVKKIADGRVFSGEQAFELKLIDTLGTFENAIEIAARFANIQGKPAIVKQVEKKALLKEIFESNSILNELKTEFKNQPILKYKMYGY